MKWNKFQALVTDKPFVGQMIDEMASYYYSLKEYVRRQISWIAYRPWEKLDLHSTERIEDLGSIPFAYSHQRYWKGERYRIYFWIGDEELPRSRLVQTYSIQEVIDGIKEWYEEYWAPKGVGIRWEAVIKVSRTGGVTNSPASVEIYKFPEDYS